MCTLFSRASVKAGTLFRMTTESVPFCRTRWLKVGLKQRVPFSSCTLMMMKKVACGVTYSNVSFHRVRALRSTVKAALSESVPFSRVRRRRRRDATTRTILRVCLCTLLSCAFGEGGVMSLRRSVCTLFSCTLVKGVLYPSLVLVDEGGASRSAFVYPSLVHFGEGGTVYPCRVVRAGEGGTAQIILYPSLGSA